jgi:hypothetical protein
MMIFLYLPLIVLFASGFAGINLISTRFSLLEKIALSFPLSLGLVTFLMLAFDLLGIEINLETMILPQIILFLVALGKSFFRKERFWDWLNISDFKRWRSFNFFSINLPWLLLCFVLCIILYVVVSKALFWPTVSFDSITGYDFVGRIIAAEGKVNTSMFDAALPYYSIRSGYPLFVSGSFAYAYLAGFDSSKIMSVILILSTVLMYYAFLKRFVGHTWSMLFTLLFISTAEYIAMSALSLSNVPHTLLAVSAVLAVFIWVESKDKHYLILGALLMALNVWARSDGVVFILGTGFALLIPALKQGTWKPVLIFGFLSSIPFFAWQLYKKQVLNISNSEVFVKEITFDTDKLNHMIDLIAGLFSNTQYYGIAMFIIPIGILLNYKTLTTRHFHLLLSIVVSLLIYTSLYYFMDNRSEEFGYSLKAMINSSYKRGMFAFIGLGYFYVAISPISLKLSQILMSSDYKLKKESL